MIRGALLAAAVAGLALVGTACSPTTSTTTITVGAASSLTDVLTDIGEDFTADTGIAVRFSFAGSSALAEQIRAGAPIDAFTSAGVTSMAPLVEEGLVGEPRDIATNALMIAVPSGNPGRVRGLADLASVSVVICQEQVPCGVATQRLIDLNALAFDPVSLEPDVRAVLTKVRTDEADAGLVYVTDVTAARGSVLGIEIPADANVRTTYQAAVVTQSANGDAAARFVDFLGSDVAQTTLAEAGFGPVDATP